MHSSKLHKYAAALIEPVYNKWARLSKSFDIFENNRAILRLKEAYSRVFRGRGASTEDCELVLCDLAMMSGAYQITRPGPDVDLYTLGYENGKKAVFEHIVNALNLNPQAIAALQDAAQVERQLLEYNQAE